MVNKVSIVVLSLLFFSAILYGGSMSTADIKPVENLDVNKYMGKWYEIARLPTPFEDGLDYVTATYTLKSDGRVDVLNEGIKNGRKSAAYGNARVQDPKLPSKLFVSFFLWFGSDYIVFELDQTNYQYAMVTSSTKDYLWILSRKPKLEDGLYQNLLNTALKNGFDLTNLIKVKQMNE
jgi:lipocalin